MRFQHAFGDDRGAANVAGVAVSANKENVVRVQTRAIFFSCEVTSANGNSLIANARGQDLGDGDDRDAGTIVVRRLVCSIVDLRLKCPQFNLLPICVARERVAIAKGRLSLGSDIQAKSGTAFNQCPLRQLRLANLLFDGADVVVCRLQRVGDAGLFFWI